MVVNQQLSKPVVSVLTTVYNGEAFIAETIEAMLSQSFEDFEFLILDDGSTDRSLAIVENYAADDSRIRLFVQGKTGRVALLNKGLFAAAGRYTAVCDADDVALPQRLSKQVAYMEAHGEVSLLGTWSLEVDGEGLPIQVNEFLEGNAAIEDDLISGRGPGMRAASMMFPTALLQELGGYEQRFEFIEDTDILFRLSEKGVVTNLQEVLIKYRRHAKSVSRTRKGLQMQRGLALIREVFERRGMVVPGEVLARYDVGAKEATIVDEYRKIHWLASRAGYGRTARKYALALLRSEPLVGKHWRFVADALLND